MLNLSSIKPFPLFPVLPALTVVLYAPPDWSSERVARASKYGEERASRIISKVAAAGRRNKLFCGL
jgi:hypothetical protein